MSATRGKAVRTRMKLQFLPVEEIISRWRPGSHDAPWSWAEEVADLESWERETLAWVDRNYMHVPIVVVNGSDPYVDDGHHRVCVALRRDEGLFVHEAHLEQPSRGLLVPSGAVLQRRRTAGPAGAGPLPAGP